MPIVETARSLMSFAIVREEACEDEDGARSAAYYEQASDQVVYLSQYGNITLVFDEQPLKGRWQAFIADSSDDSWYAVGGAFQQVGHEIRLSEAEAQLSLADVRSWLTDGRGQALDEQSVDDLFQAVAPMIFDSADHDAPGARQHPWE